ncbi:MAG TPA: CotH kinase family protein [Polyangia bacterium]
MSGSLASSGCGDESRPAGDASADGPTSRSDAGRGPDAVPDLPIDRVTPTDTRPPGPSDGGAETLPVRDAGTGADADVPAANAMDTIPPVMDVGPVVDTGAPIDVATPPGDGGPLPPSSMSVAVYDEATLIDLNFTFPAGEWEKLLTLTGPTDARWVACTVAGLGTAATPASCRRKGDQLDWSREKKPQIVVRFNRTDPNGRFRGLRRLNLESFDGAAAPIRDRLGMWVMRESGIDAPRVNNARVFKDGTYLGLYLNIEALDKEFLEDHFGADAGGNLWEDGMDLKTNEDMPNATRLEALNALIENEPLTGDHTAFFAALATRMDVAQVLREMAGETALIADDNFSNGSTNYAYYEHPKRGFLVLPWDFDSIITGGPVTADLYDYRGVSDEPSRVRRLMNQNPAWKRQFEDALVDIRDRHLSRVPAKVDVVCAQIRDAVRTDPNRTSTFADFEADCLLVKLRVTQRIAAIKQILGR